MKYIGISKVLYNLVSSTPDDKELLLTLLCCSYTIAPEQKARTTYDNILRLIDDPDVIAPIKFLRAREIVHFQRFGEVLRSVQEDLDSNNFYAFNPAFDMPCKASCKDNTCNCSK